MSRDEHVEVICYLNPRISRAYLGGLSDEQLKAYLVHLRALRLMRMNDSVHFNGHVAPETWLGRSAAPQVTAPREASVVLA